MLEDHMCSFELVAVLQVFAEGFWQGNNQIGVTGISSLT